jgi:hypothetical protein
MKDGLVAAAGVHFWTDVVFHVLWGPVLRPHPSTWIVKDSAYDRGVFHFSVL